MDVLWSAGTWPSGEIQESFGARPPGLHHGGKTMCLLYRLEAKNGVTRARKIGNAHIFEAVC